MDKATRERAIHIIGDLTEAHMFSVITSEDVVDALTAAGILLVDSRTHWAAPNEVDERMVSAYWWAVENEPDEIVGNLPAVAKHRYNAIRDATKEQDGGGG